MNEKGRFTITKKDINKSQQTTGIGEQETGINISEEKFEELIEIMQGEQPSLSQYT